MEGSKVCIQSYTVIPYQNQVDVELMIHTIAGSGSFKVPVYESYLTQLAGDEAWDETHLSQVISMYLEYLSNHVTVEV